MDPPRIKLYTQQATASTGSQPNRKPGTLFYCSLTLLIVVVSSVSIYAYVLQVHYKSEKFRCETPFFQNKRDEMVDTATRTPTPTSSSDL